MKHFLFTLIFSIMLCSCTSSSHSIEETSSEITSSEIETSSEIIVETETSTLEPMTEAKPILLDAAQQLTTSLFYIPNETLETLFFPSVFKLGENFLISSQRFEDETTCVQTLILFDTMTGTVKKELVISETGFITIQVCYNTLVIFNMPLGTISLFNQDLEYVTQYIIEPDDSYQPCYISSDLTTLYQMNWNTNCITALDLKTNTTSTLLENIYQLSPLNQIDTTVMFSYVDATTYKNAVACLNLDTKQVEYAPFDGSFFSFSRFEDMWLGCLKSDITTYFLGNHETPIVFSCQDGGLTLIPQQEHLVYQSSDTQTLSLYTFDGTFISSCSIHDILDEDFLQNDYYYMYANKLIWSDLYNGYFLILNGNNSTKLLFWDIYSPYTGNDINFTTLEDWENAKKPIGTFVSSSLYEYAQKLSEQYHVDILIADQCDTVFSAFQTTLIYDETQIWSALETLEYALASYPENFFQQLQYGDIEGLEIQFVGNLYSLGGFDPTSTFAGFADTIDNKHLIVVDITQTYPSTYYHEFSHIIDKRIAFVSLYNDNSLFSEEQWISLCPENFSYLYSYANLPTTYFDAGYEQYFIDPYSQINPTEDRARVLEMSMQGLNLFFLQNPGLQQKLLYYSNCIRECFDTRGWEETTLWEETLVDCGLWP